MSSTRQTRQRMRNNEQNQVQDDSSAGKTERAPTDGSRESTAAIESNEQPGDDYTTPSVSLIGEINRHNNPEITAEELTELGWNIYTFKEKNMKMKIHYDFLKTCLEENVVPKGLTINKPSAIGEEDEIFRKSWNGILRNCSLKLTECLVEHYDRQLAQNIAKIAETYESLERTELWTDTDKTQLEEEIHSILEPKEKQLKD